MRFVSVDFDLFPGVANVNDDGSGEDADKSMFAFLALRAGVRLCVCVCNIACKRLFCDDASKVCQCQATEAINATTS